MYRRLGDLSGMAEVASTLAQCYVKLGESDHALELYEQAVGWAIEAMDDARLTSVLHYYGSLLYDEGEVERSIGMWEEGRRLALAMGDERDALRFDLDLAWPLLERGASTATVQDALYKMVTGVLRVREPMLTAMTVGMVVEFSWPWVTENAYRGYKRRSRRSVARSVGRISGFCRPVATSSDRTPFATPWVPRRGNAFGRGLHVVRAAGTHLHNTYRSVHP